jgi:C6 transcription factor Pro1
LRAVVRSVIFAICICGCLTQDESHQNFFVSQLDSLGSEAEIFGNTKTVKTLMQKVWELRSLKKTDVDWREVMQDEASETLLLV